MLFAGPESHSGVGAVYEEGHLPETADQGSFEGLPSRPPVLVDRLHGGLIQPRRRPLGAEGLLEVGERRILGNNRLALSVFEVEDFHKFFKFVGFELGCRRQRSIIFFQEDEVFLIGFIFRRVGKQIFEETADESPRT